MKNAAESRDQPRPKPKPRRFVVSGPDSADASTLSKTGDRPGPQPPRKPPRKRWTKDATLFHLPGSNSGNESGDASGKNSKHVLEAAGDCGESPKSLREFLLANSRDAVQREDTDGVDNAAFETDPEEMLTVETDHRESTKIEMKIIAGNPDDEEILERSSERDISGIQDLEDIQDLRDSRISSQEAISESESQSEVETKDLFVSERDRKRIPSRLDLEESSTENELENVKETSFIEGRIHGRNKRTPQRSGSSSPSSEGRPLNSGRSDGMSERIPRQKQRPPRGRSRGRKETPSGGEPSIEMTEKTSGPRRLENATRKKSKKGVSSISSNPRDKTTSTSSPTRERKRSPASRKSEERENRDSKFVSVIVHGSDVLETDYATTRHPMVKVHLVETTTGERLGGVRPIATGKFDFRENRSMLPLWEEELVFEYRLKNLLQVAGSKRGLILFEIVDSVSFAEAHPDCESSGEEAYSFAIAWAFLTPVGSSGILHVDKKIRLQLYRPRRRSLKKQRRHKCEVYSWWKSRVREKYPGSIYVTVTSVDPPHLEPVFYQEFTPNGPPRAKSAASSKSAKLENSLRLPEWSRLAAQSCKIPNEVLFETEICENGCFYVAFGNDGKYLACVNAEEYDYPVSVYQVDEEKIHARFSGHKHFVYSLNWSKNDTYLLSVSSDRTARIWDVHDKIVQHVQMLPHPSYVYCGKFDPEDPSVVATGCYDRTARIWARSEDYESYELVQELEGHEGFVNSLVFQKTGELLTADSAGAIVLWSQKRAPGKPWHRWQISRRIRIKELEGVAINTIVLHPLGSRLLVHSRNSELRMLDLATGVVLRRYEGLNNRRIQTAARVSPCGGLVFCGGEDGVLNVWNVETGKHLAKFTLGDSCEPVTCVDYHPYDHLIAVSVFGRPAGAKLLKFSKNSTGESVGLKLLIKADTTQDSLGSIGPPGRVPVPLPRLDKERRESAFNLSTSERNLGSRSTDRLRDIIQKIDKILSSSSVETPKRRLRPEDLSGAFRVPPELEDRPRFRKSRRTRRSIESGRDGQDLDSSSSRQGLASERETSRNSRESEEEAEFSSSRNDRRGASGDRERPSRPKLSKRERRRRRTSKGSEKGRLERDFGRYERQGSRSRPRGSTSDFKDEKGQPEEVVYEKVQTGGSAFEFSGSGERESSLESSTERFHTDSRDGEVIVDLQVHCPGSPALEDQKNSEEVRIAMPDAEESDGSTPDSAGTYIVDMRESDNENVDRNIG
ncbi:jouberin [Orussus abietinus]|uniref:jouberin n=1 Tax=Orussus abietinus TaxID=222816 RepID=UPI000625F075|nr:jouberin [Orussus abietinus]